MNSGCQVLVKSANRLMSARYDSQTATPENSDWLDRATWQIRRAFTWSIPVGFEDEAGFHVGVSQPPETLRAAVADQTMIVKSDSF